MAIEYETTTYRTCEGLYDANCNWFQLSSTHTPNGSGLKQVLLHCGEGDSDYETRDRYLGLWHELDDGTWSKIAVSTNTVRQQSGVDSIWYFDNITLEGRKLRVALLSNPDESSITGGGLLAGMVITGDNDGCYAYYGNQNYTYLYDVTFTFENEIIVPDPEPEIEHRIVDISKYWIQIIRNTNEFKQIATAENPEFNDLLGAIYRALKDAFILEATEYGVSRWEKILGLVVTEGMTLDERKVQILNYLSVKLPYTWRVLKEMLNTVLGEGNYTMSLDNDTQTLNMAFTSSVWDTKMNEVESLLKRVLPMNLDVKYEPFPLDFVELEYLESSGTQYILIPDAWSKSTSGIKMKYEYHNALSHAAWSVREETTPQGGTSYYNVDIGRYVTTGVGAFVHAQRHGALIPWVKGETIIASYKYLYTKGDRIMTTEHAGIYKEDSMTWDLFNAPAVPLFANINQHSGTTPSKSVCRIYWTKISSGANVTREFIPILDGNGTPCMYDNISGTCFYNSGTGSFGYRIKTPESEVSTFSLRDPYYTAPSGIYARLIAENELDIIADTDMEWDAAEQYGYTWFTNTGEAYEHFNIKEVIENE